MKDKVPFILCTVIVQPINHLPMNGALQLGQDHRCNYNTNEATCDQKQESTCPVGSQPAPAPAESLLHCDGGGDYLRLLKECVQSSQD